MLHKSIRFRIQFWHSLLLAGITIALSVSYFYYEKQNKIRLIEVSLHSSALRLLPQLERLAYEGNEDRFPRLSENPTESLPPPGMRPRAQQGNAVPIAQIQENFEKSLLLVDTIAFAWDRELNAIFQSEHATIPAPDISDYFPAQTVPIFADIDQYHFFLAHNPRGLKVAFAKDISSLGTEMKSLAQTLVLLDCSIILSGIFGGWYLTGRAIRPIGRISDAATRIAAGDRNRRIETKDTDSELGQLAKVLNDTFDKLDQSYAQQVQFTADASHELRTPVAAMLSQIQLALSRERGVGEYQEHLQSCLCQANRMSNLLNSLLDLARSDSGEFQINKEHYDLAELVMESCDALEPIAQENQVRLIAQANPAKVQIDPIRMGQVLTNVIANAIHHSPSNGSVTIALNSTQTEATLEVSDQGPGIDPDVLPHIFERFFRASKARSEEHGSVGLGLAIAKTIVDKHGGTISARNEATGAVFTISLPA